MIPVPAQDAALVAKLYDILGLNTATALAVIRFVREAGPALEPGETITPADRWQGVARNMAQMSPENHAAFKRQCEAHGVKP